MHPAIQTRRDRKRGCGWRKGGGLYLVAGGPSAPCGKLPIPLSVCPTCSGGIKPTRGWTWVDADALAAGKECRSADVNNGHGGDRLAPFPVRRCAFCPLGGSLGRAGLLWVGGKFYPTPTHWTAEAVEQGVSRRVPHVPKDFKLGETWVLVAHREAILVPCPDCEHQSGCDACDGTGGILTPGVFHAFKPTAVEYVVTGEESDEDIDALVKRGITPVKVERVEEPEPEEPPTNGSAGIPLPSEN